MEVPVKSEKEIAINFDNFLYETLNSERIESDPDRLHETMYGDYKAKKARSEDIAFAQENNIPIIGGRTRYWWSKYSDFGIFSRFVDEYSVNNAATNDFYMAYEVWKPKKVPKGIKIPTILFAPGVPVPRKEWYSIARKLARFMRVVMVDLHGMGESSKPLAFKRGRRDRNFFSPKRPNTSKWLWSWKLHAEIFHKMILTFKDIKPKWFIKGKLFFGANDWGTGALQKFVESYGKDLLLGASINSAIALNGYWVQHIGSLHALSILPYPSPAFTAESIRFSGTLTNLLEGMFHRTSYIHNQYTMALLQRPYVSIDYSDPTKNPSKTIYNEHTIRVLSEQASHILGNGELLPFHETLNPNGILFSKFDLAIQMIWGAQDKMMPVKQVHDFKNIVEFINVIRKKQGITSNLTFEYKILQEAGHFAVSDQPERGADAMLAWIMKIVGPHHLASTFLGFESIARQDEKHVIQQFNWLSGILARGEVVR